MIMFHDELNISLFLSFKKERKFMSDIITFDIESTNIHEIQQSVMYLWSCCINGHTVGGRTWHEFMKLLAKIDKAYTSYKQDVLIWIHNFSFEQTFMSPYIDMTEKVFATAAHKPIYSTENSFERFSFRCSLMLTNQSLDSLTAEFTEHKQHGFNYDLYRHWDTELTEEELKYSEYDTLSLYHAIKKRKDDNGGKWAGLPLTSTGYVRKACREHLQETGKYFKMRRDVIQCTAKDDEFLYRMLVLMFAGGLTHANAVHVGNILKDVWSFDKTSDYPFQLCFRKFPFKFVECKIDRFKELFKDRENYALCIQCIIEDLEATTNHSIISGNKVQDIAEPIPDEIKRQLRKEGKKIPETLVLDNGRIRYAKKIVYHCTEMDFETLLLFYKFSNIKITKLYASKKQYLNIEFVKFILKTYMMKTTLKDVEGKEDDYARNKSLLNGIYGMCVLNILKKMFTFNGLDYEGTAPDYSVVEKYAEKFSTFLLYQHGVWCTSFARNELAHIIKDNLNTAYYDTDSVKIKKTPEVLEYFDKLNEKIKKEFTAVMQERGIPEEMYNPEDINGNKHFIGLFDIDGKYKEFKTMGAKRYIYTNGKKGKDGVELPSGDFLHSTVAGCNKVIFSTALKNKNPLDPFKVFNNNFKITANEMKQIQKLDERAKAKLTHKYNIIEQPFHYYLTDHNGKTRKVRITSNVYLHGADFSMSLSKDFKELLEIIQSQGIDLDEYIRLKKECWKYVLNGG